MSRSTMPMPRCAVRANSAVVVSARSSGHLCKVKAVATSSTSSSARARPGARSADGEKDYYEVLSLEQSAAVGAAEIKRAYRRLALRHHPDLCPPARRAESTERFLELRRAYETLSDPARRVRYDAGLGTPGGEAARPRGGFAREVWEAQLCELRARSERRQWARSSGVSAARRSD